MLPIGGFEAIPGTRIKVEVLGADDNVITFAGALKSYGPDGNVTTWTSSQLTSEDGGTATLGNAQGYNVVILPILKKKTEAEMTVRLTATGPTSHEEQDSVELIASTPFGWQIIMD